MAEISHELYARRQSGPGSHYWQPTPSFWFHCNGDRVSTYQNALSVCQHSSSGKRHQDEFVSCLQAEMFPEKQHHRNDDTDEDVKLENADGVVVVFGFVADTEDA